MLHMPEEKCVNIIQGEYRVSGDPAEAITTLLGSCVAACMHDPVAGVGGMNHFLLPGDVGSRRTDEAERYGVHLMELLVNGLLKIGAGRDRLQAKLFGGAKTVQNLKDIGSTNAQFAHEFLSREGIAVIGASLGGVLGRRIQYWPATGRARQILMVKSQVLPAVVSLAVTPASSGGDLELF